MKSILQENKECYWCRKWTDDPLPDYGLHRHHIVFGTANRKNSEKYGVWVWLCPTHHNMSNDSVHHNHEMAVRLIAEAQMKFEELYSREEWMRVFGKNWREE